MSSGFLQEIAGKSRVPSKGAKTPKENFAMRVKLRILAPAATIAALSARHTHEVVPFRSNDGAFVYLRKRAGVTGEIYDLPNDLPDGELTMEITEMGGLNSKKIGAAQVVCGLHGERLVAFFIPKQKTELESMAYFSSDGCCSVWHEKGQAAIRQHTLMLKEGIVQVVKTILWEGDPKKLPKSMGRFRDAVTAATRKAACADCMHMHYGKERPLKSVPGKSSPFGEKVAAAMKAPVKK